MSKGDIRSMVEGGCPKLQRKVVNSAKRLRVYVGLEEKSVSKYRCWMLLLYFSLCVAFAS